MDTGDIYQQGGATPKRGKPGTGARLTNYENIVSLYEMFHSAYHWTLAEVDATGLDYLLTLLRVKMLAMPADETEKIVPIDEVL